MSAPSFSRVIVYTASLFADKLYGDRPYIKHIMDVVGLVEEYAHYWEHSPRDYEIIWQSAWLHDVLEDTTVTLGELTRLFGQEVSGVVTLVTDSKIGKNREEKHFNTYPALSRDRRAVFLKLCDRLGNVSKGGSKNKMYAREHAYFKLMFYGQGFHLLENEIDRCLAPELEKL